MSEMNKESIKSLAESTFEKLVNYYGYSKHQKSTPFLMIEDSPYSDGPDEDCIGEYCRVFNELIIYWKNIKNSDELIKTLVHEYQHYLQSPTWMTRYYNMGYYYSNHPYELAAYKEETNFKMFI